MTPDAFDWVGTRAACSPEKVFQQIKQGIEEDVKSRNKKLHPSANYEFDTTPNAGTITVFIKGAGGSNGSITFDQTETGISIRDTNDKVTHEAVLTLSNDGVCRLKVGGAELELWQFRKLGLEDLFFGNPWRR